MNQLLLGDKIGNELGITEIAEAEYKVLLEMGSTNLLINRDLLGSFIKDGNQQPPVYVLKVINILCILFCYILVYVIEINHSDAYRKFKIHTIVKKVFCFNIADNKQ